MTPDETLVEFLQRVLTPGVLHPPNPDDSVTLVEDDPNVLMEVAVSTVEEPFIVIKPQQMSHLACTTGEKLRWVCDYLIILGYEGRYSAVFVELKKTFGYRSRALEQLRRSLPLLRYLEALYSVESQRNDQPAEVVYAIVYETGRRFDKQGTRPRPYPEIVRHEDIDVAALSATRALRIPELFPHPGLSS